jgi:hypothetical protein
MPTRKQPGKKRSKYWVKNVKTTAIDVPENTMNKSAEDVAGILLKHNRRKTPGSINRFIQFYINRAGRAMPARRKKTLKAAMEIVRNAK